MAERDNPKAYNPDRPEPEEKKLRDRLTESVFATMGRILETKDYYVSKWVRSMVFQMRNAFQQQIAGRQINLLVDPFDHKHGLAIDFITNGDLPDGDVIVNRKFLEKLTDDEREEQIVAIASFVRDFLNDESLNGDTVAMNAIRYRNDFVIARENGRSRNI